MQEYVDFLSKQSPYDRLDASDLERLAAVVEVEFFPAQTVIVQANEEQLEHLYVVRSGTVHVLDNGQVVDELGPGDTFGHISVFSGFPPPFSIVSATDSLCYRIPDPRNVVEHAERLTYAHYKTAIGRTGLTLPTLDSSLRPVTDVMSEVLWCNPETPIREAAELMTQGNHSAILVDCGDAIGIMTDSDCRRLVATGRVPVDSPVTAIATKPVRTVSHRATAADGFVEMVMTGVHHLVVVDASGRPVGLIRVTDVTAEESRNPLVIRSVIDSAKTIQELADASQLLMPTTVELWESGLPALRVAALTSAIREAILEKCIGFSPTFSGESETISASWLAFGSLSRHESMPLSDVDTGLVWQRSDYIMSEERPSDELINETEVVLGYFEQCGFRRCPDGENANNLLFNRTRAGWLSSARRWRSDPDSEGALLLSAILTDSRPINNAGFGLAFEDEFRSLPQNEHFVSLMLQEALAKTPPLGFVRNFVVEADGQHKGTLNLKKRGLNPIVAIARWIALTLRTNASTTQERIDLGLDAGLLTKDEADTLGGAHEQLFRLLFEREIQSIKAAEPPSPYFDPSSLDTLTRRHLRDTFRSVGNIQSRLESEWRTRMK